MSNNFLSDISNEIIQLLELEDYDGIYDPVSNILVKGMSPKEHSIKFSDL